MDYSITWSYIVKKMEELYGIPPDSEELFSMGELNAYIDYIWGKFIAAKNEEFAKKFDGDQT